MLFEMWTGAPPFTASTAQAVIAMRFTHRPPEVSSVGDGVPVWGSRAVARALARDPAERYATAAQLAAALIAPEPGSPAQREPQTEKSIAVLPFTNMSSDPEIEYFGDGIAEEIINALARLPGLRVALLHRACDVHDPFLIFTLYGFPTTARLREDHRFAEIRERMGLPSSP